MLEPITKKYSDRSDGNVYSFIFYCDVCEKPWFSVPYHSQTKSLFDLRERESERVAAYERANREAITHFNRCPACKRVVCDDCFRILDDKDVCNVCLARQDQNG